MLCSDTHEGARRPRAALSAAAALLALGLVLAGCSDSSSSPGDSGSTDGVAAGDSGGGGGDTGGSGGGDTGGGGGDTGGTTADTGGGSGDGGGKLDSAPTDSALADVVSLCPPKAPFGSKQGDRLPNLAFKDCSGKTFNTHSLCGKKAVWAFIFHGS